MPTQQWKTGLGLQLNADLSVIIHCVYQDLRYRVSVAWENITLLQRIPLPTRHAGNREVCDCLQVGLKCPRQGLIETQSGDKRIKSVDVDFVSGVITLNQS